ncbi:phosphoribosyltransferase family protein [Bordetella muralis]
MFGGQACQGCTDMRPVFTQAIAAFDYEPPFDSLIGRYKAEHRFGLSTALAQLLAQAVARAGGIARTGPGSALCLAEQGQGSGSYALKANTVLIPIPSSGASLRRRGFNPAAELAASLGACLQLPVRRGVLRRLREGPRQAFSGRLARQRGAQGLFACIAPVQGLSIGLVDDVMTTGSTVNAAAHALLHAGAADVAVLVAARTPVRDRHA